MTPATKPTMKRMGRGQWQAQDVHGVESDSLAEELEILGVIKVISSSSTVFHLVNWSKMLNHQSCLLLNRDKWRQDWWFDISDQLVRSNTVEEENFDDDWQLLRDTPNGEWLWRWPVRYLLKSSSRPFLITC